MDLMQGAGVHDPAVCTVTFQIIPFVCFVHQRLTPHRFVANTQCKTEKRGYFDYLNSQCSGNSMSLNPTAYFYNDLYGAHKVDFSYRLFCISNPHRVYPRNINEVGSTTLA